MQDVTQDYFAEGTWIYSLRAHIAVRAIVRAVDRYKRPTSYLTDLAIDIDQVYKHTPKRFVYVLRRSGTHLHFPNPDQCKEGRLLALEQFDATIRVFGMECQCVTYDEDRLSRHLVEPELMPVTAQEARAFLQDTVRLYLREPHRQPIDGATR